MRIIPNANYCTKCINGMMRYGSPKGYAVRYPVASDGKGTCACCGVEIALNMAHKIIEMEGRA